MTRTAAVVSTCDTPAPGHRYMPADKRAASLLGGASGAIQKIKKNLSEAVPWLRFFLVRNEKAGPGVLRRPTYTYRYHI